MLPPIQAETIPVNTGDLLINEVQIIGNDGQTSNDYIKIYNNTTSPINLNGYRLVKRTASINSTDSILFKWEQDTLIDSHATYTWANNEDTIFTGNLNPNATSDGRISNDNGVAIRFGTPSQGIIIDSVGWGNCENSFVQGSVFPINPKQNEVLRRIKNQNPSNNSTDFEIFSTATDTTTDSNTENDQTTTPPPVAQGGGNIQAHTTTFSNEPYDNTKIDNQNIEDEKEGTDEDLEKTILEEKQEEIKLPTILISEFLPDPLGVDNPENCSACGEFIELTNYGAETINLANWQIQVDDRPSYIFPYQNLKPKHRIALYRAQTNLILQNDKGKIILKNQNNEIIQTINYKDSTPGYAHALIENDTQLIQQWIWSKATSPGENNYWIVPKNIPPVVNFLLPETIDIKTSLELDASDSYDPEGQVLTYFWKFGDNQTSTEKNPKHLFQKTGTLTVELTVSDGQDQTVLNKKIKITGETPKVEKQTLIKKPTIKSKTESSKSVTVYNNPVSVGSISKIKTLSAGTKTTVVGTVVVPPGIFGSQYLQIVDLTGGMQVYSNKKDFPDLYIGDQIQASGEISIVSGEYRLKTSSQNEIKLLAQKHPPASMPITSDQLNQDMLGSLVNVTGKILESKSDLVYLEDRAGEIVIQLKENSGLKNSDFVIGDTVKVIGIVKPSGTDFRIWTRELNDLEIIEKKSQVLGEKISTTEQTEITDQSTPSLIIPAKNNSLEIYQYLLAFAAGVIAVLAVWIVKLKK